MLRKLDVILNIFICSLTGAFAGYGIYVFRDYRTRPGLYDMQASPWYAGIIVYGIFTILSLIVVILIRLIIRRKMKAQKN